MTTPPAPLRGSLARSLLILTPSSDFPLYFEINSLCLNLTRDKPAPPSSVLTRLVKDAMLKPVTLLVGVLPIMRSHLWVPGSPEMAWHHTLARKRLLHF